MIGVKELYKSQSIDLSSIKSAVPAIDITGCKILPSGTTLFLLLVYIPPHTTPDVFELLLDSISLLHFIHDKNTIIAGDFNIPHLHTNPNDSKHKLLSNFTTFLNLH